MKPNRGALHRAYVAPFDGTTAVYGRPNDPDSPRIHAVPILAIFIAYGMTFVEGPDDIWEIHWPDLSDDEDFTGDKPDPTDPPDTEAAVRRHLDQAYEDDAIQVFTDPTDGSRRTLIDGKDIDDEAVHNALAYALRQAWAIIDADHATPSAVTEARISAQEALRETRHG